MNIETIHRDYNALSDFVHTKEIDGEYTDTHFERLEAAIVPYLDRQELITYASAIETLTALIEGSLNTLKYHANKKPH